MKKAIKIIIIIFAVCIVITAAAGIAIYRIAIASDGSRDFILCRRKSDGL